MVTPNPAEDPRAELERLRKLKRLRELEEKAGLAPVSSKPQAPSVQGASRAIVDDGGEFDIDALLNDLVTEIPGGYDNWRKDNNLLPQQNAASPEYQFNWQREYGPKPDPVLPAVPEGWTDSEWYTDRAGGYARREAEAEAKKNAPQPMGMYRDIGNAMREATPRVLPSAGNSLLGGLDFLSEPGRWADDATGAVAPWWPAITWDDKGIYFKTHGDLSEEERTAPGLPRIPMTEAVTDAEKAGDLAGEVIGFLAPGAAVHKGAVAVGQGAAKIPSVAGAVAAITPKGADLGARAGRYGQLMVSTVPEAGAQAFVFGASNADKTIIDEDGSLDYTSGDRDPVNNGLEMATNPLTYLAPVALSGIYRAGLGITSGGKSVTPKARQVQVAPHMLSASDEAVAALGDLPIPAGIANKDADAALGILHRAMKGGGATDDFLQESVKKYNALDGDRPAPAVFLREELKAAGYPKAVENLDNALYEIGQKAPAIGEALRKMRTTQADRLKSGLSDTLGKGDRVKREKKLTGELEEMGEDMYEPILAAGAVDDDAANTLRALLNDGEFFKEIPAGYRTKLSMGAIDPNPEIPTGSTMPARPGQAAPKAKGTGPDMMGGDPVRKNIALQQRIQDNPLEVAHKLYSYLGKQIRAGKKRGQDVTRLQELQNTIRGPLFKAGGPKYAEANSKYRATAQARDALSAPDRLFAESLKSHQIQKVKDAYRRMSPEQKKSYQTSLKGLLEDELARAKANNDFVNLGRMQREGALDAIESILDVGSSKRGSDTVRLIRTILSEQDAIVAIDPATKTNRGDRLAAGREAYAGKTGAMEHTGRYEMKDIVIDAGLSAAAHGLLPIFPVRAAYRGIQKVLANIATPSRSARSAAGTIALERPGTPGANSARAARSAAARDRYNRSTRINGKFVKNPDILDPEMPGSSGARPFNDEGFAQSMSDDGPKLPNDGSGGGAALSIIDEGYSAPPQKQLPGAQRLIGSDKAPKEDKPEAPKSAAERYVDELRARAKELEDKAEKAAQAADAGRGDRRAAERAARDAEAERARVDALERQTAEEGVRLERERARQLAAEDRARAAATWADESNAQGPPDNGDGFFQKLGRMEDNWRAPAGDPRALRDAMQYLVGDAERAAVAHNLRRFGRTGELEWYNAPEVQRADWLQRAASGQKEDIPQEVLAVVGKLNKANKEWLADQLSKPQEFDLTDIMSKIDGLPAKGPKELQRAAEGPIAVGALGVAAAAAAGKALYDSREKRTPEQIEADRRRMYGEDTGDELFEMPEKTEVRQMQAALNALGYKDRYGRELGTDGVMGDRFREALVQFAVANGLQPHGLNPGGLSKAILEKLRKYYQ